MQTSHFTPSFTSLKFPFVVGVLLCVASNLLHAADGSWNVNGSGNWSNTSNWLPTAVPGGAGSTVNINNDITANRTVTLDGDISRTVGILNLGDSDGSNSFTISRTGTVAALIFSNTVNSQLNFSGNGNSISAPILIGNSLDVSIAGSSVQQINTISASTSGSKTISNIGGGTGMLRVNGAISDGNGTVAVRQNSTTSALYLTTANSYSGGTVIDAGTINVEGGGAILGTGGVLINSGSLVNFGGGNVTLSNTITLAGNAGFAGGIATKYLTLSGSMIITGNRQVAVTGTAGTVRFSGGISQSGGSFGLTKTGDGTLEIFSNAGKTATYTGTTFINEGVLKIASNNANSTFTATSAITINGGTFDVASTNSVSETVGVVTLLSGSIIGSAGTTVLNASSYSLSSGSVSKALGGSGAPVSKISSGTVTLSGSNSYTGVTTVSAGTLLINGNNTSATGNVTVNGGVLGGSGTIGGAVTVNSGATLSPGNSPGILTVSNDVTIADGGAFAVEINGATVGTEYDRLVLTGAGSDLSLLGDNNFVFSLNYVPVEDTLFFLVDNQGASAISGIFERMNGVATDLSQGAFFSVGGQNFLISYTGNLGSNSFTGGNDLVLQAVPEPNTVLSVMAGVGMLLLLRRRRKS